jgi:biopolymer transport protein ExbD
MATSAKSRSMRESRRRAQFAKFRLNELNLVPLVDTFVAIVFFALTTATVGELAPIVTGVTLPESRVGGPVLQQITIGVGSNPAQISFMGRPLMSVQQAASQPSDNAAQPLVIPALRNALKTTADSIRRANKLPMDQSIDMPLAIQGDRGMRYDLLSRIMQTARVAGFRKLTLQVRRAEQPGTGTPTTT